MNILQIQFITFAVVSCVTCIRMRSIDFFADRCFVRLFQKYQQLTPVNKPSHAFYVQPLRNPTPSCWYSKKPLGYHTLSNTVYRAAGIHGYKTNHSLRATAATRLFESGVDEQLIMERTGHRSVDGVRSYQTINEKHCLTFSIA